MNYIIVNIIIFALSMIISIKMQEKIITKKLKRQIKRSYLKYRVQKNKNP